MNTQCSDWADVWEKYRDHAKPVIKRDLDELPVALDASGGIVPRPAHGGDVANKQFIDCSVERRLHNQRVAMGRAVLASIGMTPVERIYR